jgi:RHS repeat-associated protein
MTSALYGDGYTQTRTYDLSYRLTGLKDALGATKQRDLTYGFEGRDNLTAVTDAITSANSETFTYTPRENLTSAAGPYGALAYTYDGVGNRLTAKLGTATDTYAYPTTSNRLTTITLAAGGTRGYTYDAAGNVTAEARTGGPYASTYDAAGRMSVFKINNVQQASYKYDAMGRQAIRTLTSPTAITIHSVFDSEGRRIAEYNQATGALIREYVWLGWDPVAVIEGGVVSFVRADHIGRPVFATNASGVKVWTATYNPFGGVYISTGSPPNARFPGQWFQSESGLHQNWMRDYDPTTGRYLQADPLGLVDGASVYGYVGQSPLNGSDPDGLKKLFLTNGGWIIDRDWTLDPRLPPNIGNRFKQNCSNAEIVFHRPTSLDPKPHWHYYPDGEGKAKDRDTSRWRDAAGKDHFYSDPVYILEVEDCPCENPELGALEVALLSIITILLIIGTDGLAIAASP